MDQSGLRAFLKVKKIRRLGLKFVSTVMLKQRAERGASTGVQGVKLHTIAVNNVSKITGISMATKIYVERTYQSLENQDSYIKFRLRKRNFLTWGYLVYGI